MKRIFSSLLLMFALSNTLQADYDQIDYTNTELPSNTSNLKPGLLKGGSGMFAFETNSDFVSKSKFDKKAFKHQGVSFCGFSANGSMIFYYNKKYHEAANVEIGYDRTNIHWKENPFFEQNIFNTVSFSINAQSSRMCNWLWKGKLTLNVDADHFDLEEYSTWDCFIWGRNTYSDTIGIHIGIIALTGMKIDHVYPIIGVDWIASSRWKINAVFPVNVSIIYMIDQFWSVNLRGRAIETRYRVGKNENLKKALVQYLNKGIEFGVDYEYGDSIQANIHVGQMLGGRYRISDKNNHHPDNKRFNTAPYVGAEVMIRY